MKVEKIMLVALLFAILTVGAVSASDDNATAEPLTVSGDADLESSLSDENLQVTSQSDILGNSSVSGTFKDLNDIISKAKRNDVIKLDKDYVYNNITDSDFKNGINIDVRLTVDGQGHTIDGSNQARIFTENVNLITLQNINFINGNSSSPDEGVIHNHNDRGTFINCSFVNCSSVEGGAITCQYGGTISNCTFINCSASKQGGALSLGDECVVSDCRFLNCSSFEAGAIRAINNNNILNCEFMECSSIEYASVILNFFGGVISNCTFQDCYSMSGLYAINLNNDGGSVLDCNFINCPTGAISASTSDWRISGCNFTNVSGGSISAGGKGIISKCIFENCNSISASAIFTQQGDSPSGVNFIEITDCSFVNCSSQDIAGAVWAIGPEGIIYGCIFMNCSVSNGGGGAIWTDHYNIFNCSFEKCSAPDSGAVRNHGGNITKCNFTDCNTMPYEGMGGAVVWGANHTSISECIFVRCTSSDGGAIQFGETIDSKIADCKFINCSATHDGGAISGTVNGSIISCSFENCLADYIGGAIAVWDSNPVNIIGCNFADCSSPGGALVAGDNINVVSSNFTKCVGNQAGAINLAGENNSFTDCRFEMCEADYGAAIFLSSKNNRISNSRFISNHAYEDGGAVYGDSGITVENSIFTDNSADFNGGALLLKGVSSVSNSTFKGNKASKGKAIWTDDANLKLTSNKLMHASGENRNDLIYGVSLHDYKDTNDVYNGDRLVIIPDIDISYNDLSLGEDENVKVTLPSDMTGKITMTLYNEGKVIKTASYDLNNGVVSETYSNLVIGVYNIIVKYPGDVNYWDSQESVIFMVRPSVDITQNSTVGENVNMSFDLIDATGSVKVFVDGKLYSTFPIIDNKLNAVFNTSELAYGNHNITFEYVGSSIDTNTFNYWDNQTNSYLPYNYDMYIAPVVIEVEKDMGSKSDKEGVVVVELPEDATGTISVFVENEKELVFDVIKGIAMVDLSGFKDGSYDILYKYSGDNKYSGFTKQTNATIQNDVPSQIIATMSSVKYANYYSVTVKTKTDKLVNGATVTFLVNGKSIGTAKSNSNGVASIAILNAPKTYKITSNAGNVSVDKSVKVTHLVCLKSATVKKSAKKLTLQATLGKVNGKYVKNKQVTFKFNGKTYKAKTNSKGVAKVTIKSNVLKKLKVNKKVTYQATYLKDTVKKTAKVKK